MHNVLEDGIIEGQQVSINHFITDNISWSDTTDIS